jgi:2-polyprenyl-3-methyl-5-hydroxy-6-metoxy-1,4-benzoquinol methylase
MAYPATTEQTACPLCGGQHATHVLTQNAYPIVRCTACGLLYVRPMPSLAALEAHYQSAAYFEGAEDQGYANYADVEKALRPHFQRRLHTINTYLPDRGRLLDFGCAAGYFLQIAQHDGWHIAGVELSRAMAEQASQMLDVPIATTLDDLPPGQFDAITLWEVIEHMPDPLAVLRQLCARLRPGGVLMLSTPNTGHWQAVRAPELWRSYRPPSHLIYFTAATLEETLRTAGFERIAVQKTGPLPPLPPWLDRLSAPLEQKVSSGQARVWPVALWLWRGVRVLAWGWQKAAHPHDDIFATLEAVAVRPA